MSDRRSSANLSVDLLLPGGVIGNTRVFGTRIPGSSPGRVSEPGIWHGRQIDEAKT